jgi:LuxR family transcriptional regulator, maltose regulon positive regulatory protein
VGPLVETKLYVPRRRLGMVPRPRLAERLRRGAEAKLTLVSAPAGFGKTTLLTEWLAAAATAPSVAWLSLDQRDNDPPTFWAYLIAALQTVAPGVGADALTLLRSSQPPAIEAVLATLLNHVGALSSDVVVVLDDYHAIDARDIQDGVAFLLDHLPVRMHLVIASRVDPPLPLARLRARGELVEIRAADLRFTPDEAAAYLNGVMSLELGKRQLAALEGRTEGWIAALQLAALSMQGRDNLESFIDGFAGDDRYIVDYLVEEVLQRQSQGVRCFLLHTCVLDRLSGSLCDAVTGQDSGKTMLQALERANLFVVPLDDRRQWYRYHHLFADVLRAHLAEEQSTVVPDLHRRASTWFEHNGDSSQAVSHALAAEDFARAAHLIELVAPEMLRTRQEATLRAWLKALPDNALRSRPVLSNAYAGALLSMGETHGVEARLQEAERWLDATADDAALRGMVVADEAQFRRLPGAVAVHRAGHALLVGNVTDTVTHARRALDLVSEDDLLGRGAAAALLGLASWAIGDLEQAHLSYAAASAALQTAGHISDVLGCAIALADLRIAQGRLHEAMRTFEQGLQLATKHGPPVLRGTADMYVGMSELYRERNHFQAAQQCLRQSQELGEHIGLPQNRYRSRLLEARIREVEGDLDGALELLAEVERLYTTDFSPDVRPIPAVKARVLARHGRLREAMDWVHVRKLSASDEISYVREYEHITLARVLLARHSVGDALELLDRLLRAAEDGARGGSVIEILILQALACQAQGDVRPALARLERALTLAEPEGYVRIFVDEGAPMATLLTAATKARVAPDYARQLLQAVNTAQSKPPAHQELVESLTERELDVLRLLATDLSGPEIAGHLTVSLSTVRTHTQNVFNKLGVNNRRAAVRRAEELKLLT